MIKNLTSIEIKKEDRLYQFICEPSSPLGELHDVLTQMKNYVVERIKQADEQKTSEGEQKCPTQAN